MQTPETTKAKNQGCTREKATKTRCKHPNAGQRIKNSETIKAKDANKKRQNDQDANTRMQDKGCKGQKP